jgi:hypothetical protein
MSAEGKKIAIPTRSDLQEGVHYYINEQGYWVFTETYHKLRGYCCKNNCKHCPYGFNAKQA